MTEETMMQIAAFANEMEVLGYYLLRNFEIKTGKTNKPYIDVTLEDKTGQVNAKIWNLEGIDPEEFQDIIAVKVKGKVREYNGTLQLNIEKMRPVSNKDSIEFDDLIPSAPEKGSEMYAAVMAYADNIVNYDLKKLTVHILDTYKDKLEYYPAAKSNHHSIRGGLLYHILRMLEASKALCDVYKNVSTDLLYTGVILHDIAKIEEMNSNELGIVTEYSKEGELLGHITIGANIVHEAGKELGLDPEAVLAVKHMILSHHYEADFGSPKKPCFIEAELLHYIDMIDARVYDMEKATKDIEKGTFSEPVLSIERRKIYRPGF
jgi:3'-5' exoribonuclease